MKSREEGTKLKEICKEEKRKRGMVRDMRKSSDVVIKSKHACEKQKSIN